MSDQPTNVSTTTETSSPTEQGSQTSSGLPTVGEVPNDAIDTSFEGLGNDFDENSLETQLPTEVKLPSTVAAQPTATTPQVAAVPKVQPQTPPTASLVESKEQQQPPANGAATQTEDLPATVDNIVGAFDADDGSILSAILPAFALTQEQYAALEADAPAEIPRLLANTYMRAVSTALQYVKELVPRMIQQHQTDSNFHRDAEQEFFGKFKGLNAQKHGNDIRTYARAFAQANPGITRQQLFDLVGTAVMVKHGVAAQPAPQPSVHRAPAFQPAGRSAPIVNTSVVDESPFAALGMDFET